MGINQLKKKNLVFLINYSNLSNQKKINSIH